MRACLRVFVRVPVRVWCLVCVVSVVCLSWGIVGMCMVDSTTNE
jgi:hypothetical protein